MESSKAFVREQSSRRSMITTDDPWTVESVCALLGVPIPSDIENSARFSVVCSNDVPTKDCLFILCRGMDPSGATEAVRRGALAVLTEADIGCPRQILVEDIIEAQITLFAKLYEKAGAPSATVITGSVGKTTTTQMVNCVYSTQYRTFYDDITENVFTNLAAQLQRVDRQIEKCVMEVSEKPMYCTRHFSRTLHPHIALITTIDRSHIAYFGSEENIFTSLCAIADGMDSNGVVIINADDPKSRAASFRQRTIRVSILDKTADCVAEKITQSAESLEFDCVFRREQQHIRLKTSGMHNVYNAMMAYVAGRLNGISPEMAASGLERFRPRGYRQKLYHAGGKTVYADCYNASGRSIHSALNVMNLLLSKGKKAAILGDVLEIEGFEDSVYESIAYSLDASDIDVLVTFGKTSCTIASQLTRPIRCIHCDTYAELNESVRKLKKEGIEAFLFKGSRDMHMEQAIKAAFPMLYYRIVLPEKVRYYAGMLRGSIPDDF